MLLFTPKMKEVVPRFSLRLCCSTTTPRSCSLLWNKERTSVRSSICGPLLGMPSVGYGTHAVLPAGTHLKLPGPAQVSRCSTCNESLSKLPAGNGHVRLPTYSASFMIWNVRATRADTRSATIAKPLVVGKLVQFGLSTRPELFDVVSLGQHSIWAFGRDFMVGRPPISCNSCYVGYKGHLRFNI